MIESGEGDGLVWEGRAGGSRAFLDYGSQATTWTSVTKAMRSGNADVLWFMGCGRFGWLGKAWVGGRTVGVSGRTWEVGEVSHRASPWTMT